MNKLFSLLLLIACGQSPLQKDPGLQDYASVNLGRNEEAQKVKVTRSDVMGPAPIEVQSKRYKKQRKSVSGLFLGPGMMNTISYLGALKELELKEWKPTILLGIDFGSLLSALYAKYSNVPEIEWRIFKLFKQFDGDSIFQSLAWKKRVHHFIRNEFSNELIEDLEKPLYLIYENEGSLYYLAKGSLVKALEVSLGLSDFQLTKEMTKVKDLQDKDLLSRSGMDLLVNFWGVSQDSKLMSPSLAQKRWLDRFRDKIRFVGNSKFVFLFDLKNLIDQAVNYNDYILHGKEVVFNQKELFEEFLSGN